MADIPAANITSTERDLWGSAYMWKAKVKGNGAGTTITAPFGRILACWMGNIDDTAGTNYQLSFSGNVVTYGGAPTINKYHWLYVLGTD